MSHRATEPNSRFPKRKQLRKDEVRGFVDALDFKPDAYFFDVSDAGPRELAKAMKEQGVLVYYEPEGNKETNKFLKCIKVSDVICTVWYIVPQIIFRVYFPQAVQGHTNRKANCHIKNRPTSTSKISQLPHQNLLN